ncbi:MAG: hypothetical protein ACHQ49_13230 [Elusimicrobiota bacterium]
MNRTALAVLLAAAVLLPPAARALDAVRLTDAQAEELGRRIWINEAGGKKEALVWWNDGEKFASVGIGHFIWFPADYRGPFVQTFPRVLAFMESSRTLPDWLKGSPACPWPDRESFRRDADSPRVRELRDLLVETIGLQARWIANRLETALPKMAETLPPEQRPEISARFDRVAAAPNGLYALIDYLNFKGEGVSPSERYNGRGWGLLEVLQGMQGDAPGAAAVDEFSRSAERVLRERVDNSPPANNEKRWLPTWLKRVATYRAP